MDIVIWIFLAIVFFILELITTSFFLVSFGVGSCVAAILNYFGFDMYVQFTAFAIVSLVLLLSSRKFAKKITKPINVNVASERLIGREGVVLKKINDSEAIVNIASEDWVAYVDENINVDDKVKVLAIDSIKLIVEKI